MHNHYLNVRDKEKGMGSIETRRRPEQGKMSKVTWFVAASKGRNLEVF